MTTSHHVPLGAHFFAAAADWLCECGERASTGSARWRWNGFSWEHHHGYPMGHVEARHSPVAAP